MYVPSLISIPLVLSKIWPGQATIMKKWLKGDYSILILYASPFGEHIFFKYIYNQITELVQTMKYTKDTST